MNNTLSHLPTPSARRVAVHLKPAAERAVKQGHPWVFEQGITRQSHAGQAGDLAVIYDQKNRFLAVGLYDPTSPIRVKVLQTKHPAEINAEWFRERLQAAADLREPLLDSDTNGYRLVHGENDGLPGLVIDRYDTTLVIKLYTAAWLPHLRSMLAALEQTIYAERWVLRLARTVGQPFGLQDGTVLKGTPLKAPLTFQENGLLFTADVTRGHKTGFFFDQRDNRALAGKLAQGRTVLDVFAYVGAFAVYCARGGAAHITSVDVSAPALETAKQIYALNRRQGRIPDVPFETMTGDAFQTLTHLVRQRRQFDMVIIDPPTFASSEADVPRALKAYNQLAEAGAQLLAHNGIFVMASCSSRVDAQQFFETIIPAATAHRPDLTEILRTDHALDHPIGFPEGAYLKCWFARDE
ncbi:class I SAM-dependent rRNA methyltransferase (plasmid) [Aggregatilineales bacterium SYSU G02658]